jgi:hypothetical protein
LTSVMTRTMDAEAGEVVVMVVVGVMVMMVAEEGKDAGETFCLPVMVISLFFRALSF